MLTLLRHESEIWSSAPAGATTNASRRLPAATRAEQLFERRLLPQAVKLPLGSSGFWTIAHWGTRQLLVSDPHGKA